MKRTWRSFNGGRRNKKQLLLGDSAGFLFCVCSCRLSDLSVCTRVFFVSYQVASRSGPSGPRYFFRCLPALFSRIPVVSPPPPTLKCMLPFSPAFQARASHERTQNRHPNLPLASLLYPSRFVCILRILAVWIFLPLLHAHRNSLHVFFFNQSHRFITVTK